MKYILKSIFLLSFLSLNIVADEALFMKYADTVSYTHLRAHET